MLTFKEFEKIINTIKEHDEKLSKISDFLEENVCEASYCFVTIGDKIKNELILLLCRCFNAPVDNPYYDNDISWWLYEDVDKKIYYPDGTIKDVSDLKDFYIYLKTLKSEKADA